MAIVKMKRLRLIAMARDQDKLAEDLLNAGCVEISQPPQEQREGYEGLLCRDSAELPRDRAGLSQLQSALDVLKKLAPVKEGLLAPRRQVDRRELLDSGTRERACRLAEEINSRSKTLGQLAARETRLRADALALAPWADCDTPLEDRGTRFVSRLLGTAPAGVDFDALAGALAEAVEEAEVTRLSADREQQYLEVLVYRPREQEALECLRAFGFSLAQLKELTGTARENLRALDGQLAEIDGQRRRVTEEIRTLGDRREELKLACDSMRQVLAVEEAKERVLTGGAILCLDGWVPAPETEKLEKLLAGYDCAWELTDPAPEEYPQTPVKLKNGAFSRCMNTITEMYSLPAYDGVDPNPLMAPFFILFFGFMMADMAYGLLMIVGSAVYLRKARPKNPYFMEMIFWCGISTFIVGALTGGFFGDFIPQLLSIIDPASTFEMPALVTPLDDIVAIMIGSLILGVIQIFTGMGISVYRKVKEGDFIDALFSEISWWIILAGLGLWICGMMVSGVPAVLGTAGKAALIVGALMLAVGGTRNARGFGKVTALVGIVYNGVTGYFSDTLSYIRLMALMVSGSVIASVFNTLGATFGNVILFVIISMLGNALNFALNLLGCYVHDLRLQCLEFFGRFYKEGGKPFAPLSIQTNYVDVIKEEH